MGHMDQARQHVRSTKIDKPISLDEYQQEPNNHSTHNFFATIEETGKVYTDQTGQFPALERTGNRPVWLV